MANMGSGFSGGLQGAEGMQADKYVSMCICKWGIYSQHTLGV